MATGKAGLGGRKYFQMRRGIDLNDLVNVSAAGAGAWTLVHGGWASPTVYGHGETSNNNAKTVDLQHALRLHELFVSTDSVLPGDAATALILEVTVKCRLTGTPATSGTLDLTAFRSTKNAGVDTAIGSSGELVTTGPQDLKAVAANTWQTIVFEVDVSEVGENDVLNLVLRGVNNDTGGTGGGRIEIGDVEFASYEHQG